MTIIMPGPNVSYNYSFVACYAILVTTFFSGALYPFGVEEGDTLVGGSSAGFAIPPYTYFGQSETFVVVRDVMTTSCGHINSLKRVI